MTKIFLRDDQWYISFDAGTKYSSYNQETALYEDHVADKYTERAIRLVRGALCSDPVYIDMNQVKPSDVKDRMLSGAERGYHSLTLGGLSDMLASYGLSDIHHDLSVTSITIPDYLNITLGSVECDCSALPHQLQFRWITVECKGGDCEEDTETSWVENECVSLHLWFTDETHNKFRKTFLANSIPLFRIDEQNEYMAVPSYDVVGEPYNYIRHTEKSTGDTFVTECIEITLPTHCGAMESFSFTNLTPDGVPFKSLDEMESFIGRALEERITNPLLFNSLMSFQLNISNEDSLYYCGFDGGAGDNEGEIPEKDFHRLVRVNYEHVRLYHIVSRLVM